MDKVAGYLKSLHWEHIGFALFLLLLGFFLAKKLSQWVSALLENKFSKHHAMLVSRLVYYGLFLIFLISALQEVGFNLTLLLGTAGLFTVALSFASQTAASNLISGIFLLFERPFQIGDVIAIKETRGTVEAIDWLSTKIRSSDNRLIRIPNEALIKSEITNLSVYSQKRDEITLRLEAKQSIRGVKKMLKVICAESQVILANPGIRILVSKILDDGKIELKLFYWSKQDLSIVRDELLTAIHHAFAQDKVEENTVCLNEN